MSLLKYLCLSFNRLLRWRFFRTSTFDLFKLPVELRLMIYRELLVTSDWVDLRRVRSESHEWILNRESRQTPYGLHPAILRVRKQVYDEAMPLLYAHNRFSIERIPVKPYGWDVEWDGDWEEGFNASWMDRIGVGASHIRHIFLRYVFAAPEGAEYAEDRSIVYKELVSYIKTTFPRLRTIEFNMPAFWPCWFASPRWPFPEVATVLDSLDHQLRTIHSLTRVVNHISLENGLYPAVAVVAGSPMYDIMDQRLREVGKTHVVQGRNWAFKLTWGANGPSILIEPPQPFGQRAVIA